MTWKNSWKLTKKHWLRHVVFCQNWPFLIKSDMSKSQRRKKLISNQKWNQSQNQKSKVILEIKIKGQESTFFERKSKSRVKNQQKIKDQESRVNFFWKKIKVKSQKSTENQRSRVNSKVDSKSVFYASGWRLKKGKH